MSKELYPYLNPNLPLMERVNDLVSRMTLEEKIGIIPTHQKAIERLGVKEYHVGGEAAHGVVARIGDATVFPQPIGLSCTWDEDLMKEIGSVIGDEARVYYKLKNETTGLTLWAPTIDMERDPRWGRTEEAYGEDPYLTGKLSANLVKGMQGDDPFYLKMVPAPKHFYANNNEVGRIYGSSSVDPRNKHEYYLEAFRRAYVEGKAGSMMTAYNEVNGTPMIVNPEVKKIVKEEWGCDGFIVCDGGDMSQTVEYHKYYETHAETIANAIKSGVDVMTDKQDLVIEATREALEKGLLTEKELDEAVKNVFKIRFRLGQFDPKERNPYENIDQSVLCSRKHQELALKAARESIVLLKNENHLLPLNKEQLSKIAVIGPLSDVLYRDWYTGTHPYTVTPLAGIKNKFNKEIKFNEGYDVVSLSVNDEYLSSFNGESSPLMVNRKDLGNGELFDLMDWGWNHFTLRNHLNQKYVTTDDQVLNANADEIWGWFVREQLTLQKELEGYSIKTWNNKNVTLNDKKRLIVSQDDNQTNFKLNVEKSGIEEAMKIAEESDVAIVIVGNHPLINGKEEIDREDITLPERQLELIKACYEANPNTIVVIIGSYPYAINWVNENIPAIMYTSHGSQELGNALSDVLFGDYSPSGRLSMTWYRSVNDLPSIFDYDIIKGKRTYQYFDGDPLYPFGYGLTYVPFNYENLRIEQKEILDTEEVKVQLSVTNLGEISSDEVIQLYAKQKKSRVIRPNKQLVGFKRVSFKPNETKEITFILKAEDLKMWDVTREKFCVETGDYELMVGTSSKDIYLSDTIHVSGEIIPSRDLSVLTKVENFDDYHAVSLGESKEGLTCLKDVKKGSWVSFHDVHFMEDIHQFEARVLTDQVSTFELRLDRIDGRMIGSCEVNEALGLNQWLTVSCQLEDVKGIHDLYLIFNHPISLSWLKLK